MLKVGYLTVVLQNSYLKTSFHQFFLLDFCGLLCYLNLKYKVEKYAANKSFKWHIFEKQWSLFQNIFEE